MDLDAPLSLEDAYYNAGYEEGSAVGHEQGLIEGRIYGSEVSYERFFAVGLLYSRVAIWKMDRVGQDRILKHIAKVEDILRRIPLDNGETAEGEDYETLFALAVSKTKVITSLCGESNLTKQGIVQASSSDRTSHDLEDGAEISVKLRGGGSGRACAT